MGDVDRNGDIDIIDATLIQKMALNITRGLTNEKILAILLVGVMSVTAFGFNASAVEKTDAEIQQEKLGYILNLNKDIWLDCAVIYDGVWPSIMDNAREVYDTDGLSADEYTVALKQVYDMYYDAPLVNIEYAEATYKNALKEENYNNWYSENEWNDFQEKLKILVTHLIIIMHIRMNFRVINLQKHLKR